MIASFEGLVHDMVSEVDALMEIAAAGSPDKLEVRITIVRLSDWSPFPYLSMCTDLFEGRNFI